MRIPGGRSEGLDAVVLEQRGIVDQERQGPDGGPGLVDQGWQGVGIGQVGGQRVSMTSHGLDLAAHLFGVIGGMVVMHKDAVAGLGRLQRQATADAPGRAGDQRAAPSGHRGQSTRPNSRRFSRPMAAMKTMIMKIADI